jgi:hypothetical protein
MSDQEPGDLPPPPKDNSGSKRQKKAARKQAQEPQPDGVTEWFQMKRKELETNSKAKYSGLPQAGHSWRPPRID